MRYLSDDEVKENYFATKHFENMKNRLYSKEKFHFAVSFRPAGPYSVLMLEAGAGAKPHTILGKTIKDGTIEPDERACPQLMLLYGLVAHRKNGLTGPIDGLYQITDSGEGYKVYERGSRSLIQFISDVTNIDVSDLEKNFNDKNKVWEDMSSKKGDLWKKIKEYAQNYIAGDYDMHDLIGLEGRPTPIPSSSFDEKKAMYDLISTMVKGKTYHISDPGRIEEKKMYLYYPVQHGPSYNYIAQMYDKEPTEAILAQVAEMSLPVLMINPKPVKDKDLKISNFNPNKTNYWLEISTVNELKEYYDKYGVNIKYSWNDFHKYILARKDKSFNEYMKKNYSINCFYEEGEKNGN